MSAFIKHWWEWWLETLKVLGVVFVVWFSFMQLTSRPLALSWPSIQYWELDQENPRLHKR